MSQRSQRAALRSGTHVSGSLPPCMTMPLNHLGHKTAVNPPPPAHRTPAPQSETLPVTPAGPPASVSHAGPRRRRVSARAERLAQQPTALPMCARARGEAGSSTRAKAVCRANQSDHQKSYIWQYHIYNSFFNYIVFCSNCYNRTVIHRIAQSTRHGRNGVDEAGRERDREKELF